MTPQHPAATEGETDARCTCASDGNARRCPHHTQADYDASAASDASGLTDFDVATLSDLFEANRFDRLCEAVERIVAERLRVVEGERDAARARVDEVVQLNTEKAHHVRQLMARLAEVAEVAEGRGSEAQAQKDRAESAEAAYRAMFRQFEAMRADRDALRARVEALADEWKVHALRSNCLDDDGSRCQRCTESRAIRALLPTSDREGDPR